MTCARPEQLARWVDGDATQNEVISLTEHVAACGTCRNTKRRLERTVELVRQAYPAGELSSAAAERYGRQFREKSVAGTSSAVTKQWLWGASLAVAALVLAVISPLLSKESRNEREWTARGATASPSDWSRRLGVEIFRHSAAGQPERTPAQLQEGSRITPQDGFSFVVYNRSGKAWHYMLFGIDAENEVHWFYPAYTVAGSNPAAPTLPPQPEVVTLPEGVTAESPAQGKLKMVALFSPIPFRVEDVEAQVLGGDLGRLSRMPGSVVQVLNLEVFR